MQGPMLKALRRFTQLLRVHIYVPGCCKYIRMTNGLQPLVELCMDGCFAGLSSRSFFGLRSRSISSQLRQVYLFDLVNVVKAAVQI